MISAYLNVKHVCLSQTILNTDRGARGPPTVAVAEAKQRSQRSVIGWLTQNLLFRSPPVQF
jgi:hypothetical protein